MGCLDLTIPSTTQLLDLRLSSIMEEGQRDFKNQKTRKSAVGLQERMTEKLHSPPQQYGCLNKTSRSTPPRHANKGGRNLLEPRPQTRNNRQPRNAERISRPRNEPSNQLPSSKQSALKLFAYKQHQTDSTDCLHICVFIHICRI